jgi:hypothetical protein
MTAQSVRDARPPLLLVRSLNPVLRLLLRSQLGRLLHPLALITMVGRRTGRRRSVPVGWYSDAGVPVVFTPAGWRWNFVGGAEAVVHHDGHRSVMVGTLVTDPAQVATSLSSLLGSGTSPRALGLDVPEGRTLQAPDVVALGRTMIRFRPPEPAAGTTRSAAPLLRP